MFIFTQEYLSENTGNLGQLAFGWFPNKFGYKNILFLSCSVAQKPVS
jgi:hypothetical protein